MSKNIMSAVQEELHTFLTDGLTFDRHILRGTIWLPVGLQFWVYPNKRPEDRSNYFDEYQALTKLTHSTLEAEIESNISDHLWRVIRKEYAVGIRDEFYTFIDKQERTFEIVTDYSKYGPMMDGTIEWDVLKEGD